MSALPTIGTAIRSARENAEMPLRKLAAILDIDQSTLSKIERGERRPSVQMLEVVSATLDAPLNGLLISFYSDIVEGELAPAKGLYNEVLDAVRTRLEQRIPQNVK